MKIEMIHALLFTFSRKPHKTPSTRVRNGILSKMEFFLHFSNTITSCLGSRLALSQIRFENVDDFKFYREEKVSVFENTRLRVYGEKQFENATCGRRFFNYGEKKIPFSKIPCYVWPRPKTTTEKWSTGCILTWSHCTLFCNVLVDVAVLVA